MNVIPFVVSIALFLFGVWLLSFAPSVVGFEAILFFLGIVSITLALALPFNVLGRSDHS